MIFILLARHGYPGCANDRGTPAPAAPFPKGCKCKRWGVRNHVLFINRVENKKSYPLLWCCKVGVYNPVQLPGPVHDQQVARAGYFMRG